MSHSRRPIGFSPGHWRPAYTCEANMGPEGESAAAHLQGTRLIYYNTDSDILLLSIPGAIPDHYEAYHLGFDAAMNAVPTSAVVIHHPDGSPKSISYVNSRCSCSFSLIHPAALMCKPLEGLTANAMQSCCNIATQSLFSLEDCCHVVSVGAVRAVGFLQTSPGRSSQGERFSPQTSHTCRYEQSRIPPLCNSCKGCLCSSISET